MELYTLGRRYGRTEALLDEIAEKLHVSLHEVGWGSESLKVCREYIAAAYRLGNERGSRLRT